jgi:hypothetical protein
MTEPPDVAINNCATAGESSTSTSDEPPTAVSVTEAPPERLKSALLPHNERSRKGSIDPAFSESGTTESCSAERELSKEASFCEAKGSA